MPAAHEHVRVTSSHDENHGGTDAVLFLGNVQGAEKSSLVVREDHLHRDTDVHLFSEV